MSGYEMWAWLVLEEDGTEGVITAVVPGVEVFLPLHHRRREMAERLEELAWAHGRASGRPVRLAHLVEVPDE